MCSLFISCSSPKNIQPHTSTKNFAQHSLPKKEKLQNSKVSQLKAQKVEVVNDNTASNELVNAPEKSCLDWFDGCNTCSVKDGKVLSCTEIMCYVMEEPRCLAHK